MPLDVATSIKFTPTDASASLSQAEGVVYFDNSDNQLRHHDGTRWRGSSMQRGQSYTTPGSF